MYKASLPSCSRLITKKNYHYHAEKEIHVKITENYQAIKKLTRTKALVRWTGSLIFATTSVATAAATPSVILAPETATSHGELHQLRVDNLISLLEHRNQVIHLLCILLGYKRVCSAGRGAPSSTSDPMNIILRRIGVVVIDYKFDPIHI